MRRSFVREIFDHASGGESGAVADRHPLVSEPLTTIVLSVRNTATLLEVLVAT